MEYNYETFDDFKEFKKAHPRIAKKLLDEVGEGAWMEDYLTFYPTIIDFAKYEVLEGWYAECNLHKDFRGVPNLLDFIQWAKLAEELVDTFDNGIYWSDNKVVVTSSYGW